jgi:restriction system protein
MSSSWYYYDRDLDAYEGKLDELVYAGVAPKPTEPAQRAQGFYTVFGAADGPLTSDCIASLLSSIRPEHGYGLLAPLPIPEFPYFPSRPDSPIPTQKSGSASWPRRRGARTISIFGETLSLGPSDFDPAIILKEERLKEKTAAKQKEFENKFQAIKTQLQAVQERCAANDYDAVRFLINLSHARQPLPFILRKSWDIDVDKESRILLCTFEIPDFRDLNIVKKRGDSWNAKVSPVSAAERKRSTETLIYSLCLRAAYLAAKSDVGKWFDTIAVNAKQKWNDAATGQQREGIIASLQAQKAEIANLKIQQVDPKACFRHLKGLSTPSTENATPIRPIFVLNKDDKRIVQERDVAQELDTETNIAAMPWEDFEHLVRQLFKWEFGHNGVEVKVFRLSRDHGVDAVMYDPDPLRGGKYVLQAKRYTRPVDVAAVRDLYGTVVNEGANRGILVTTSSLGPDSYDFAKDKPISLVDGPNLVAMLSKHGRRYRIDLEEARRLAKSQGSPTSQ